MKSIRLSEKKRQKIPEKYFDIIDFFINVNNKKRHPQQICKGIYGRRECKPGAKGSHYSNIRKKCKELLKLEILESSREISIPKRGYKAEFYRIKENLEPYSFQEIARRFLDEEYIRKQYNEQLKKKQSYIDYRLERKLLFMDFAQNIININFLNKRCDELGIKFPDDEKDIFLNLFSNFPGALYEFLFHQPEKKVYKKSKTSEEEQLYAHFTSLVQIAVYIDIGRDEYLEPDWWSYLQVRTKMTIHPKIKVDLSDCNIADLKIICKQKHIKFSKIDNESALRKKISKKLKKGESIILEKGEKRSLDTWVETEFK